MRRPLYKLSGSDAGCPFFSERTKETLVCEGVIQKTHARNKFQNARAAMAHYRDFCCGRWEQCAMYAAVMEKYKDD